MSGAELARWWPPPRIDQPVTASAGKSTRPFGLGAPLTWLLLVVQSLPGLPLIRPSKRGTNAACQRSPNPAKRNPAIPATAMVPRPPMTQAMQTATRLARSALTAFWWT